MTYFDANLTFRLAVERTIPVPFGKFPTHSERIMQAEGRDSSERIARVVLVSGANRGIGRAIAQELSRHGYRLSLGARDPAALAEAFGGETDALHFARFDACEKATAAAWVDAALARFGRIDGLVNNAGLSQVGPFLELRPAEWDAVIATDLSAAFHTSRVAIPAMLEQGGGSIVNIASRLGQMGIPETAAYSAAKAGLIGLTRSLAREFGGRGIRVNAVAPGFTITEMTADLATSETGKARLRDMPVGRFAEADEVADAVIFLLSDRAAMFLGQTLNPNGGGYMP
jgi:3-oxoacyl-[acyl-carrier protein] reductase